MGVGVTDTKCIQVEVGAKVFDLILLADYVYELASSTHSIYKSQSGEIYKSVSGRRRQSLIVRFINLT